MLKTYHTVTDLRQILFHERQKGRSIGFVPTMGSLHKGHISLVEESKIHNSVTVCSIFINPAQFNDPEDFLKYPKDTETDSRLLDAAGCDYLFLPDVKEIYPDNSFKSIDFDPGETGLRLEGKYRPGHFAGMVAVVKRLFDIVTPDNAYFGYKDFQQYLIVKKMVSYYKMQLEIAGCPIIREKNGLAMSSRNQRLSPDEKDNAALIYQTLLQAADEIRKGILNFESIMRSGKSALEKNGNFTVDYFDICNVNDLSPAKKDGKTGELIILAAVYAGKIRLIDNIIV